MRVVAGYEAIFAQIGLDARGVFERAEVRVWRSLPDRENATLDVPQQQGPPLRFHVKRYPRRNAQAAAAEVRGIRLLERAGIPTVPLAAWGVLSDGRSFLISEDLAGYRAADRMVADGYDFDRLLLPTAELAARLHGAGLHHRDLYLCHFFVKAENGAADVRLIDATRVRPLPWLLRRRWIVKDLAQFWYSMLLLNIEVEQRSEWLGTYAQARGMVAAERLGRAVQRKAAWIGRHDEGLRRAQPQRNISIPD